MSFIVVVDKEYYPYVSKEFNTIEEANKQLLLTKKEESDYVYDETIIFVCEIKQKIALELSP